MSSNVMFLLSLSVVLPLVVGATKYPAIRAGFFPFYINLVVGLLTEIASRILIKRYHESNAVPINLSALCEWLLVTWQFRKWGLLRIGDKFIYLLLALPTAIWILENIVWGKMTVFSPYYRVIYAFLLALMSISEINFKITHENTNLLKNPVFIISIGLLIYYVYQMLYEWSYEVSIIRSSSLSLTVSSLFAYINASTNIIFAFAFLLVPKAKHYTLQ